MSSKHISISLLTVCWVSFPLLSALPEEVVFFKEPAVLRCLPASVSSIEPA